MKLRFFVTCIAVFGCGSNHGMSPGDGGADGGSDGGDAGTATALACPSGGFAGGLDVMPGQNLVLTTACDIDGDLTIGATGSGAATLDVETAALTVHGNIMLAGAGNLVVRGSGSELRIDNQSNFQRSIEAHDTSSITLDGCTLATNLTGANNFTSNYNAHDSSTFTATDVAIDTSRSWLLGNLGDSATLTSTNSAVPVEIYANDRSTVSSNGASDQHTIWMELAPGTSGAVTLPDPSPPVTWSAGRASGQAVGWQVSVNGAMPQLAFSSHAGSSWQLHGSGSPSKEATIGVYVDPATTPTSAMAFANLPLGTIGTSTTPFAITPPGASSPQLAFYGVNIGPIGWQIYVGGGGAASTSVTIDSSVINEVGVFTGGQVVFSGSVSQLAVLAAEGSHAGLHVTGSDIWAQSIIAADGGTIEIDSSKLHGSLLEADANSGLAILRRAVLVFSSVDAVADPAIFDAHLRAYSGPVVITATSALARSAAAAREKIEMKHLLRAASNEYASMGKVMTQRDSRGL